MRCPIAPGDRLWVRESWGLSYFFECKGDGLPRMKVAQDDGYRIWYQATCGDDADDTIIGTNQYMAAKWRPSIHMPRWASRLTLEVTGVRVERVQEIGEYDAVCEGVSPSIRGVLNDDCPTIDEFHRLWDSINDKRGYGWDVNPWVWVVEFRRVDA